MCTSRRNRFGTSWHQKMPVHNQKGPETYQTPRLRKYLHENRDIYDWVFIVFLILRSIFVVYNRIISLGWKNDYGLFSSKAKSKIEH